MISPLLIAKVFGATSSLAAAAVGAAFGITSITFDSKPAKDTSQPSVTEDTSNAPDQHTDNTPSTVSKQTKTTPATAPTQQQRHAAYAARLTTTPKTTAKAVVVKSSSLPSDSSLQLTTPQQTVPYKCKLPSTNTTTTFKCKIFKLDTTKKWVDLTTIKNTTTQTTLNATDLSVVTNFFKIEVEDDLYAAVNLSTRKQLDIVNTTTPATKYATLTTLFKVANDAPEYIRATHMLATGPSSTTSSIRTPTGNSYCTFESSPTAEHLGKECAVLPFGSTTVNSTATAKYSDQTLAYSEAKPETSVENKYYLVKWTSLNTHLNTNGLEGKNSIFVAQSYSNHWSTKATLTNLVPVIVSPFTVSSSNTSAVAFIMTTHTPLASS